MLQVRLHLKIYGSVQGVGFRWGTQRQARKLGLKGWVKNLPDGSVECVAESEQPQLEKFLSWCKGGDFWAQVENIEENWEEASGEFSDFAIRF